MAWWLMWPHACHIWCNVITSLIHFFQICYKNDNYAEQWATFWHYFARSACDKQILENMINANSKLWLFFSLTLFVVVLFWYSAFLPLLFITIENQTFLLQLLHFCIFIIFSPSVFLAPPPPPFFSSLAHLYFPTSYPIPNSPLPPTPHPWYSVGVWM